MKNTLKSIYITLTPVFMVIVISKGLVMALNDEHFWGTGLILAALPLTVFLSYILLFRSLARTRKNLLLMQLVSMSGLVICLSLTVLHPTSDHQPLLLAATAYISTLMYIYWYSENERVINPKLAPGNKLPDFSIPDSNNNLITAASLRKKPTILMFTRGNWCPLCMAQINEVVAAYKALDQLGVQVAIIASQPEKNTQSLAAKFNVPFMFLIDKDQKLGKQLGIIHRNGLPLGFQVLGHQSDQYYPTVLATDHTGTIIYSDQTTNYRVRPEPEASISLYQSN